MAQFTFPLSIVEFKAALKDPNALRKIGDVDFVYGCLRQGWMNKMYRKEKQQEDQELLRRIKNDPDLVRRLADHDKQKGV